MPKTPAHQVRIPRKLADEAVEKLLHPEENLTGYLNAHLRDQLAGIGPEEEEEMWHDGDPAGEGGSA